VKETPRNWYLLALLRKWKILLPIEVAALVLTIAAVDLVLESTVGTVLMAVGVVVFVAVLAYLHRSVTMGGDK
jgi:hypothetical protein